MKRLFCVLFLACNVLFAYGGAQRHYDEPINNEWAVGIRAGRNKPILSREDPCCLSVGDAFSLILELLCNCKRSRAGSNSNRQGPEVEFPENFTQETPPSPNLQVVPYISEIPTTEADEASDVQAIINEEDEDNNSSPEAPEPTKSEREICEDTLGRGRGILKLSDIIEGILKLNPKQGDVDQLKLAILSLENGPSTSPQPEYKVYPTNPPTDATLPEIIKSPRPTFQVDNSVNQVVTIAPLPHVFQQHGMVKCFNPELGIITWCNAEKLLRAPQVNQAIHQGETKMHGRENIAPSYDQIVEEHKGVSYPRKKAIRQKVPCS